ncbi:MAG: anti-sigma factor, partial [Gaiellaceae bacterium]
LVWASTAAAAAAAAVAVGLGLWGNSLSGDLDRERERLAVLADPDAARVPLDGADGTLVRSESGQSVLLLSGLERAPAGKTYEIWVIPSEEDAPQPAGLFEAGGGNDVVVLTRPAHAGATIAVTLEREGGVDSPTGSPLFTARA